MVVWHLACWQARCAVIGSAEQHPLYGLFLGWHTPDKGSQRREWIVEYTDEFEAWWSALTAEEQASVDAGVLLLEEFGPLLARPHSDTIKGSRFPNMKELRV